jgi:UDP-N-acetyl-D-mannosaminuronic acid transferase (WecB/TagA/CpsF family)
MGVPLDACSAEQFVATVEGWVDDGDRQFAVPVNAHLVNLANRDPELAPGSGSRRLRLRCPRRPRFA